MEASALVPPLKDQALIGHPAGTRLIGVYLLPDELASIWHGGVGQVTIFCRAYVISEFGSEEEATASFGRMIAGAKREASKKFDPKRFRSSSGHSAIRGRHETAPRPVCRHQRSDDSRLDIGNPRRLRRCDGSGILGSNGQNPGLRALGGGSGVATSRDTGP